MVLWGYVLIWYARRDGSIDVEGRRKIGAKALQYSGFGVIGHIWRRAGKMLLGNLSKDDPS